MSAPRHFLELRDHDGASLRGLIERARAAKLGGVAPHLAGRTLALVLEQPSTRTRVSFEVAMRKLGGATIALGERETQLGRGETIADTARVLSRYVDAILLRTRDVATLRELAAHARVPVINGLTPVSHPCQLLADVMTLEEWIGPVAGQTVAWCGDGNNVARSWVEAAVRFGFALRLACPPGMEVPAALLDWARAEGGDVRMGHSAAEAVRGARAVVTDCWVSMSDDAAAKSAEALAPFCVTTELMAGAAPDAVFLHCLPAYRGREVEAGVIDGPRSAVWDEAENRLWTAVAVLGSVLG
jgi:ornithine carbamoyltransferase